MNPLYIRSVQTQLRQIANTPNITCVPFDANEAYRIHEAILAIAKSAEEDEPQISVQLFHAKDILFYSNYIGQAMLNACALGEVIFGLDYLMAKCSLVKNESTEENGQWSFIHPLISKSSKGLYVSGHYANAAEDAFIEINDRVKRLFAIVRPGVTVPDGDGAMTTVFSPSNPMVEFCDRGTTTGFNKQKGFMQMLAGAMSALRNPKAHSNKEVLSAQEAYRRLAVASMLMYAIDEAVEYSGITE